MRGESGDLVRAGREKENGNEGNEKEKENGNESGENEREYGNGNERGECEVRVDFSMVQGREMLGEMGGK